jgi:hypothetical protein
MNSAEKVEMVTLAYPELTHFGFESVTSGTYAANRARMFGTRALEEFDLAIEFLKVCRRINSISRHSSYGWKHVLESWFAARGERVYVSNGMFIAAAIAASFRIERVGYSPNCRLNISNRSWNLPFEERRKRAIREGHVLLGRPICM